MSTAVQVALAKESSESFRQILGLRFFTGSAQEAVDRMRAGGLLVVPAAPALKDLPSNGQYREALLNADLAITDSSFMVLIWNAIQRDSIPRVSGLAYLRLLLELPEFRQRGRTFWVMASETSARRNVSWLRSQGVAVSDDEVYVAPLYKERISDPALLARLHQRRPAHVVVTIGGGNQERLGLYLKTRLDFRPAIHCIGAAMAFLSGDQVRIPMWADRAYLGWLLRCVSKPSLYVSRYWQARKLLPLMLKYRDRLPECEITVV
jgi:UDP-N-acetyl-D-mannosaminuronic acid transferase (WecB/TagA/CpsF family)